MSRRALRKERKRKGLCPECGGPMDREGWACRECTDIANERKRRWANERITNGTCPKCGQKALPGKPYCQVCKDKTIERNKLYPWKGKRIYTANDLERIRRKRRERQAKGLCPECGLKMDREGWACSICTEKLRLRARSC